MSATPNDGLSVDQRDLAPGWHGKAVAAAAVLIWAAVTVAWKILF